MVSESVENLIREHFEHVREQRFASVFTRRSGLFQKAVADGCGFRVTAAPVRPLDVDRIEARMFPVAIEVPLRIGGRHDLTAEFPGYPAPAQERPVVRGRQRVRDGANLCAWQDVYFDGVCEIAFVVRDATDDGNFIFPSWVLGGAANVLRMIEAYRGAKAPGHGYELECEVYRDGQIRLGGLWSRGGVAPYSGLESGVLPRLNVGPASTFGEVLRLVATDLLNAAHQEILEGEFEILER